jgi:hypothetical protein
MEQWTDAHHGALTQAIKAAQDLHSALELVRSNQRWLA